MHYVWQEQEEAIRELRAKQHEIEMRETAISANQKNIDSRQARIYEQEQQLEGQLRNAQHKAIELDTQSARLIAEQQELARQKLQMNQGEQQVKARLQNAQDNLHEANTKLAKTTEEQAKLDSGGQRITQLECELTQEKANQQEEKLSACKEAEQNASKRVQDLEATLQVRFHGSFLSQFMITSDCQIWSCSQMLLRDLWNGPIQPNLICDETCPRHFASARLQSLL